MQKKFIFLLILASIGGALKAQQSTTTTNVLALPVSTRVAAMGGENVSVVESGAAAGLHNPALLSNATSRTLGLDFMMYGPGTYLMGAQYAHAFGERHTTAYYMRFMNYGSMYETTTEGTIINDFTPKDLYFGAGYSYLLSDKWSGGANLKFDYSQMADFSAFAIAVDVGLNYYDPEKDISIGIVARNVGAQLKTFNGKAERLPTSLQAGFSTAIGHTPFHFNLTAVDLNRWNGKQYFTRKPTGRVSWSTNLINHFVVGIDYVPFNNLFWLSVGYNARRSYELSSTGMSSLAGFTAGGGFNVKKFSLGLNYAVYHRAYSGLMANVSYSF